MTVISVLQESGNLLAEGDACYAIGKSYVVLGDARTALPYLTAFVSALCHHSRRKSTAM